MANESVEFNFLGTGAEDLSAQFRSVGDNAALAAKGARLLADAVERQRKATDVSAGATIALAKADKILADAEHVLSDDAMEAEYALKKQAEAAKKSAKANVEAKAASEGAGKGLSAMVTPMGALGVGLAALAPIAVTVGAGLGGLGLAAAGVIGPVIKASQSAGGLAKAMHTLTPDQQAAAKSFLALKTEYGAFSKALAPVVLKDFAAAVRVAGHVMADLRPVSQAAGVALGQVLDRIDAEFRSRQWQQFFAWMAQNAGPDVKVLGDALTGLLGVLPPLLEGMQPLGGALLVVTASVVDTTRAFIDLVQVGGAWVAKLLRIPYNAKAAAHAHADLSAANASLNTSLSDGVKLMSSSAKWATVSGKGFTGLGGDAKGATVHIQTLAAAVDALNAAEVKGLNTQLAYSNALIAAHGDAASLATALKASHDRIGLQTAAQRASFSAANTYIADLEKVAQTAAASGHGVGTQIRAIRDSLPMLEKAKTHNKEYWQEVATLKKWLDRLRKERTVHEQVKLTGQATWSKLRMLSRVGAAAGMLVPGTGSADTVPAMLTPGETVVPKRLTPAVAPLMKAAGVPGFAAGGIVGSYAGSVGGMAAWGAANRAATLRAFGSVFAGALPAGSGGAGVARWAPLIAQVLALLGQPASYLAAVEHRMNQESGGNPAAINLWDVNAQRGDPSRGLMQVIGSTFAAYAGPFRSLGIWNPEANIFAGLNYALHAYPGRTLASVMMQAGGYDNGGWLQPGLTLAVNRTGRPEQVMAPATGRGGRNALALEVRAGDAGAYTRFLVEEIRRFVRITAGGDVQTALGRH